MVLKVGVKFLCFTDITKCQLFRNLVYITTNEGSHTFNQSIKARRLFYDFDCDYIVIDSQGVGIGVFDNLVQEQTDDTRNIVYPARSCVNDDSMASRCKDLDAPKIIYSIKTSLQFNSDCAVSLRDPNRKKRKDNKLKAEICLKKIKDKEFIRNMLFRTMLDGIAVSYLEMSKNPTNSQKFINDFDVKSICELNSKNFNISVCNLPADYIQIVGIKNVSYKVAFDLNYFTTCTGEKLESKLRRYPKEIREAFYKRGKNQGLPMMKSILI